MTSRHSEYHDLLSITQASSGQQAWCSHHKISWVTLHLFDGCLSTTPLPFASRDCRRSRVVAVCNELQAAPELYEDYSISDGEVLFVSHLLSAFLRRYCVQSSRQCFEARLLSKEPKAGRRQNSSESCVPNSRSKVRQTTSIILMPPYQADYT